MAVTRVSDVIIPEVFNPYVINRSAELSAFQQSGIVQNTPEFDALLAGGGTIIDMPFWNDLSGDSEVLSDTGALTPGNITSGQDRARRQARGKAWGTNDLAGLLSGDDPMRAIGDLVAGWQARDFQKILLSTLKGVFSAADMAALVSDISAAAGDLACFTAGTFIDAQQLLGDAADMLTGIAMHSATRTSLRKQNLITTIQPSADANPIDVYMGKRVIVDDGLPTAAGVFTSYLFGAGALALGDAQSPKLPATETDRDILAGDTILVNRREFILHPRGVAWVEGGVAGKFPTNLELEAAARWDRVYDVKKIRIVKFVHKLK